MIPLSRLLPLPGTPRAAGSPVAFGRAGERSAAELRRDVGALAARLAPAAGSRVLLHCEDAYAFAVGLFAVGHAGACAVLPPSRQPGALGGLAGEVAAAVLDGAGAPDTLEGRACWHPLETRGGNAGAPLAALDREAPWVELFTSGTTGGARRVRKAVRHLEDEVAMLEERFGPALGAGTRVLATVSPQHLYGLLFRVLWPLAAGRPFLRTPVLHPEELLPHCDAERDGPFALVTTPASIRRLVEKTDSGALRACRAVFSSGGPLAAELARRAARVLGGAPLEIYGSTETGGVAVRRQHRGDEPWEPLPGVGVERDPRQGCLAATSPFVSGVAGAGPDAARDGGRARFVLGDRVALDGRGGFRLLGRADRVVKVGEKRLSLPEMERRLAAHPAVEEAALVALEPAGETRVGAVLAATPAGRRILEASGRRGLAAALGEHLAPDFDRVLLPRAWRVVEALPRDAQGKVRAADLRALFDEPEAPGRRPQVLGAWRGERVLERHLRIPEKLDFLEGHFPGQPVVAGVVQVHFAMAALAEILGTPPRLRALAALKFRELLLPGQEVRLRVEVGEDGRGFDFRLSDAGSPERIFCSGRGRLEPAA